MKLIGTVTLSTIAAVPVPPKTNSYQPVPYIDVVTSVKAELDKSGLTVIGEEYSMTHGGNAMRGNIFMRGTDSEQGLQVTWVNSYDKSTRLVIGLGSHVFICSNGMLMAEYGMKRKHTTNVLMDFMFFVRESISNLASAHTTAVELRERMKPVMLTKRQQAELAGRIYLEHELLSSVQMNVLKSELEKPTHNYYHKESLWDFYNYVTFAMKTSHPTDYLQNHVGLTKFIQNEILI